MTTDTPISPAENAEGRRRRRDDPGGMADARRRPRLRQADRGVAPSATVFVITHLLAIRIAGDVDHDIDPLNNYLPTSNSNLRVVSWKRLLQSRDRRHAIVCSLQKEAFPLPPDRIELVDLTGVQAAAGAHEVDERLTMDLRRVG